jgi:hypothetical protein
MTSRNTYQAAIALKNTPVPRRRFLTLMAGAAFAAAIPLLVVTACGPFFDTPIFVPTTRPESQDAYAGGKLGVLQPGYWKRDKVVAYRYLTGGSISTAERAAYLAPRSSYGSPTGAEDDSPAKRWRLARAEALHLDPKIVGTPADPPIEQTRSIEVKRKDYTETASYLNCSDDAFVAAAASLRSRAKVWGASSPDLADWVKAQDDVFSNCAKPGAIPQPARSGASNLLRYDREYQVAAANFYAGNFDAAIAGFETVGRNPSSPWQPWGEYLAGRAEVRKAAMTAPSVDWGEQAKFDPALLQKAHDRLASLVRVANPRIAAAAQGELNFIEVRLTPQKRLDEVAAALAGPKPDVEFAQDLADLVFLTAHNTTGTHDMLRWMGEGGTVDPLAEWRSRHSTPWLIAALSAAKSGDAGNGELEAAAAKIPASSPGYVTASYQRARLMLASKDYAAARTLTSTVLSGLNGVGSGGARNALLSERLQTATSYEQFLADAPRKVVATDNGDDPEPQAVDSKTPVENFDWDATAAFNRQLPLTLWVQAARSKNLPDHLRRAVAMAAWLRALGLEDAATVKAAAELLPPAFRTPEDFATTLLLLRNPGVRPYVEQGQQRSADYSGLDSFRDNWWCMKWGEGPRTMGEDGKPTPMTTPVMFLSAEQKRAVADETKRLNDLPNGVIWLGHRAMDYAKDHPDDKSVPEALALTVRATRYGCYTGADDDKATLEQKAISKEAFNLLHSKYPKSPWTAKTPYYY